MKTTIYNLFCLTPEAYERQVFELWMRYCIMLSFGKENDLQRLLANTALNNWYMQEFERFENRFLEYYADFAGKTSPDTLWAIYKDEFTKGLMCLRCPTLIENARKTNIIPQLN
ncbi:MAG: hypothetical protein CVU03_03450 [Bacteroidetes bacterium HGW-Bacteroidetes-2]|jgi:hypothetical protein|nr:MAG: hypothetical protein CVU03_03450 [Bacteroidetes bacterium HGW-Bacteroidetes-2]